jgi:hypothetical protein
MNPRHVMIISFLTIAANLPADRTSGDVTDNRPSAILKALIDMRQTQIQTARRAKPGMFEIVDRHLPLFEKPLLVPTPRRQAAVAYLSQLIDVTLLDQETRAIVERYPVIFQQLRVAAEQWLADADETLQAPERFNVVESVYRRRFAEIQAECTCPHNEFQALVSAAGPHNLQHLPPLDPEYLLAWEAVLLREDVLWSVKGQVLQIVFRFRDGESVPTLAALRHMAIACEKKRDPDDPYNWVNASSITQSVMSFLLSQPTRAALIELADCVRQEQKEEKYQKAMSEGVIPPTTTLVGLSLSQSEEWKELLDTVEAEKDLGEYVALLREAMRLTAGKKTKERD